MKYLDTYILFENLQQAENYVTKQNLDPHYYEFLKDYIKERGKVGLMYLLTLLLYSNPNQEKELNKIKKYVDKIISMNIKIDANQFIKEPQEFYQYVDEQVKKTQANKFVDEYAPGFLKKEIKSRLLPLLQNIDLSKIEKESLKGKMSIFEKPEDWVKYVIRLSKGSDDLSKLESSPDIDILYEDDNYIIYYPKTYKSINYINYPQWCTIYKDKYNDYIGKGYYFIVLHNKQDKKLSYIIQVYPDRDDAFAGELPINAKNYFSIHPYNGKAVWESWSPNDTYLGWDIRNLNKGILKIFFDRFVKNNRIKL